MPDPISYLKASVAAVFASAMIVLVLGLVMRKSVYSIADVIGVLAVSAGAVTGYGVLHFSWTWPPATALNRFLMIVLPATVVVELLAAVFGRARLLFGFRLALYASVGRILLHDSVYLGDVGSGNQDAWTFVQALAVFGGSFAGLIAAWSLLCQPSSSPDQYTGWPSQN